MVDTDMYSVAGSGDLCNLLLRLPVSTLAGQVDASHFCPRRKHGRRLSFKNDRRKSDRPQPQTAKTMWPSSLRRFEDQILTLVDVWAYPSGNAWLLHDDGTIVEIPSSDVHAGDELVGSMRHAHTRVPLIGQWSIVVGGIAKTEIDRFTASVQMLARMARQQGELEATASVAIENGDEVAALQQLVALRLTSLNRATVLNYLAETTLTTVRSAAALIVDENGLTSTAGTSQESELLAEAMAANPTATIMRAEDTSAQFDCASRRILDGEAVVAIAGLPGLTVTSSQLRHLDHVASHADGLLRLVRSVKQA